MWSVLLLVDVDLYFFSSGISNAEARQPGKAPNFSVNWTVGDQALEVINATTGKDDMGRASRLCKNALYNRWVRLHSKVNKLHFCSYHSMIYTLLVHHSLKICCNLVCRNFTIFEKLDRVKI